MQTRGQSSPTGKEKDAGRPRHCAQSRRNAKLEETQAIDFCC